MSLDTLDIQPRLAVNMLPDADGMHRGPYIDENGCVEVARNFKGRLALHMGKQVLCIFGAQVLSRNEDSVYSPSTSLVEYYLCNGKTGIQTRFGDGLPVVRRDARNVFGQEKTVSDGHNTFASRLFLVSGDVKMLLGFQESTPDILLEVDAQTRNLHLSVHNTEMAKALGMPVMLEFPSGLTPLPS